MPSTSQVWVACRGRWSLSGIVIGGRVCQGLREQIEQPAHDLRCVALHGLLVLGFGLALRDYRQAQRDGAVEQIGTCDHSPDAVEHDGVVRLDDVFLAIGEEQPPGLPPARADGA